MAKTYRKPHQFKRKKPFFRSGFFWLGLLIIIILSSVFYFLFFYTTFQVGKINISGENKVSKDNILSIIENKLEQKIIFFKTKSIFLINLKEIKKEILDEIPQIDGIEIKRQFPDALNAVVTERMGVVLWCQNEKCFLADKEGIIFEEKENDDSLIKITGGEKTNTPLFGEEVIAKEDLEKILKIASKLKSDFKIPIKDFLISSESTLTLITEEGWEIYFTLKNDIDWQITKLGAVLEEKIPAEKRRDLEYIELRFGNFAPFKFK